MRKENTQKERETKNENENEKKKDKYYDLKKVLQKTKRERIKRKDRSIVIEKE